MTLDEMPSVTDDGNTVPLESEAEKEPDGRVSVMLMSAVVTGQELVETMVEMGKGKLDAIKDMAATLARCHPARGRPRCR